MHAGSRALSGIRFAFLQAVLPEHYEVAGYGYVPYMAVTSADRSKKSSFSIGIKAGVCDNTVDGALLGAYSKVAFRHSRNSFPKVQDVRERLGLQLVQAADLVAEGIEGLLDIP